MCHLDSMLILLHLFVFLSLTLSHRVSSAWCSVRFIITISVVSYILCIYVFEFIVRTTERLQHRRSQTYYVQYCRYYGAHIHTHCRPLLLRVECTHTLRHWTRGEDVEWTENHKEFIYRRILTIATVAAVAAVVVVHKTIFCGRVCGDGCCAEVEVISI